MPQQPTYQEVLTVRSDPRYDAHYRPQYIRSGFLHADETTRSKGFITMTRRRRRSTAATPGASSFLLH
jgi:hypothetical protein